MLRRLLSRVRHLLGAARFRRELDEEIAFHVDALSADLVRQGMDPVEARRQARIRFGSVEHVHERAREARGVALLDELWRDVRLAARRMRRSPIHSATFVLTLALCIGLGAAVFSVADAVLWRPLPYPAPERLATALTYDPDRGKNPSFTAVDGVTWERIRDEGAPLQRAVYSGFARGVGLSTDEAADFVRQVRIGAGYFETLGIAPLMGREFTAAEDVPDGPAVAILSHRLWFDAFEADPSVLGSTVRLKGEAHTVVGVMPDFDPGGLEADVWTPLRPAVTGEGAGTNYSVLLRVPEGMSFTEADARLAAIEVPSLGPDAPERRLGLVPLLEAESAGLRGPMLMVVTAFALMLLVGCANLAGLQIARVLAREGETATRRALGGGTGTLVREAVAENLLLGVLGALAGLAIATAATAGLDEVLRGARLGIWQDVRLDARAVGAALALAALATVLFSLAPVLHVARGGLYRAILGGSRVVAGRSHGARKLLLVAQVALVTTLLIGAGVLLRSYQYLNALDPGFDPEGTFAVTVSLDDARYGDAERVTRLFDESLEGIRALPGVTAAAVALSLPYEQPLNEGFRLPGSDQYRTTNLIYVSGDYFPTLGMPLLRGRVIDERDRSDAPLAVIANESFVDTYLDGRFDGSTIDLGSGRRTPLVGLVGNVQQASGWGGNGQPVWETPTLYVSPAQLSSGALRLYHTWFSPSWIVRGSTDLASQATEVLRRIDPELAVARVVPLEDVVADAFAWERLQAAFLMAVASFTLLLAVVGLYGIVAHEVNERRGEIGLRLALGASPRGAAFATAATGLRLAAYGMLIGSALGLWLAGLVGERFVFGLAPRDPVTLAGVLLLLSITAAAATLFPAARIARIDAAEVLKAA